jgi:hypothetical protein
MRRLIIAILSTSVLVVVPFVSCGHIGASNSTSIARVPILSSVGPTSAGVCAVLPWSESDPYIGYLVAMTNTGTALIEVSGWVVIFYDDHSIQRGYDSVDNDSFIDVGQTVNYRIEPENPIPASVTVCRVARIIVRD